jgi:hypothetical protein
MVPLLARSPSLFFTGIVDSGRVELPCLCSSGTVYVI